MPTGHYRRKPRVERIKTICKTCGAERLYLPSKVDYFTGYCSRKCQAESMKTGAYMPCGTCGKMVYVNKYWLDRIKQKFCSRECQATAKRKFGAKWRDPERIKEYMREY